MRFLRVVPVVTVVLMSMTLAAQEKLTLEQVIANHLSSIGTADARAAVKSRAAEGKSIFENVNSGGSLEGKATLVSQANSTRVIMKFPTADYPGEDIIFNGDKIQVWGRPQRSALGYILYNQSSALLTDGLLEGTLSTAWPLLDPKLRSAKLTYEGLKTIDGQQLHEVRYLPKKHSDMDIRLYFSKDDYRHVLTVAKLTLAARLVANTPLGGGGQVDQGGSLTLGPGTAAGVGSPEVANATQQEIRYRIEERFSDFNTFDGLTLPTSCQIRYDMEGQRLAHQRYTLTISNVINNVSLDERTFQIK